MAVATDSPQAQAEREASQTAYVDASAPQAQTLMQDTFAQRDSLVAADPMSIPDPGTVEGWIGDRAARIDPPGDEDPYVLTSTYPLRVRDDSGDLRALDFELVRDGDAYAPANVAEEVSLPAAATDYIQLPGIGVGIKLAPARRRTPRRRWSRTRRTRRRSSSPTRSPTTRTPC